MDVDEEYIIWTIDDRVIALKANNEDNHEWG